MKKLHELIHNQEGISLILVALCLVVFMGFIAIVVDVGALYFEKSRLQKALDAAVLGGAQMLPISEDEAKSIAIDLVSKNSFSVSLSEVDTGANYIQIDKTVNKDLTFARVIGFNDADVTATARAEILNNLKKGDGIIPLALEKQEFNANESYVMHFESGNGNNANIRGNFGFLAIGGNGANHLEKGIMYGRAIGINEEHDTEPGYNWGKVRSGFQYRIDQDAAKEHCQAYNTADKSCSRVVTVPLIDSFEDATGRSKVKIIGFAAFWIEKIVDNGNQKRIQGRFINLIRDGEFTEEGENFGIFQVKLVK